MYSHRVLDPHPAPLPLDAARPGVLPAQRFGAIVEVLLCSGFPTQLLLISLLTGMGLPIRTTGGGLSPLFVFTLSLADAALVIDLVLFFLRAHRERAADVLLGGRPVLREVLLGVGLLPVLFLVVVLSLALILTFAPGLHNVPRNPLEDMLQNRQDALMFAVVATIAGGVREEIQRGFILHRFEQYLGGGLLGVLVFSAVFGLGHVDQGRDVAIVTALLGATWGLVYLTRRSIVAPMVSHAGFNLAQLVKYVVLR